jgi:hypothetical protein
MTERVRVVAPTLPSPSITQILSKLWPQLPQMLPAAFARGKGHPSMGSLTQHEHWSLLKGRNANKNKIVPKLPHPQTAKTAAKTSRVSWHFPLAIQSNPAATAGIEFWARKRQSEHKTKQCTLYYILIHLPPCSQFTCPFFIPNNSILSSTFVVASLAGF